MRENLDLKDATGYIRWGNKSKGDSLVKYLANLEDGQRPRVRIRKSIQRNFFSFFQGRERNKEWDD